eukprot:544851-Prorocentrum_minimum.AAC.1
MRDMCESMREGGCSISSLSRRCSSRLTTADPWRTHGVMARRARARSRREVPSDCTKVSKKTKTSSTPVAHTHTPAHIRVTDHGDKDVKRRVKRLRDPRADRSLSTDVRFGVLQNTERSRTPEGGMVRGVPDLARCTGYHRRRYPGIPGARLRMEYPAGSGTRDVFIVDE